ncbi:hypothetical protein CIW83_05545 [Tissierella sp. P1]|uniref:B12-binding domain-containing radical SAM protein n=1 Tax=Tissierella sp. P1 TaxID=1280483 RepID=UPI000BA0FBFD|nr:radical SAM protein [Tissierella sp. P1]OZV13010.1 hypothetical protein CIW83_05545 [Tissierella sp. P1]
MNKVLLFYPNAEDKAHWLPYAILTLGTILADNEFEVVLIDEVLYAENPREIEKIVEQNIEDTLFVGISSFIGNQIRNGLKFAKIIRTYNCKVPIVWGGWHPSILKEVTIKSEYVDFIIQGQGELIILELANKLVSKDNRFSDIDGLIYMDNGLIKVNKERKFVQRSELPNYNWELIDVKKYIVEDKAISDKTVSYISSQGCPLNCGFCSENAMYKRGWYANTAYQMYDDINFLLKNYDIDGISFYDSNFTVDKKRILTFCELVIRSDLKFKWAAAADILFLRGLTNEEWELLRKSGCTRLLIGAESGSEKILNLIGKKFKPKDVIDISEKSIEFGISLYFTMIVGWPENPIDDFQKTKELIESIREKTLEHEFIIHIYAPFIGTPLYQYACENGYIPPKTLEDWANYDYYKITTPWISKEFLEKVEDYRMHLNISYNMNKNRKKYKKDIVDRGE